MTARWATLAAAAGCALALAACGLKDPYADDEPKPAKRADRAASQRSDARAPVDRRDPDDYGRDKSPPAAATRDVAQLASAYGLAAGNWSWRTYARQYDRLLALAGGPLRRELQSAPPDPEVLRSLRTQRQTNRAELVGVDPQGDTAIVVFRELAGASGRVDVSPVHTVYQARIGPTPVGQRVVEWERMP